MPLPNYSSRNVRATAPGRGAAPSAPMGTLKGDVIYGGEATNYKGPMVDPSLIQQIMTNASHDPHYAGYVGPWPKGQGPQAAPPRPDKLPGAFGSVPSNFGTATGAPMPANPGIAAGPGVVQTQSSGQTGFPAMQQEAQAGQPPIPPAAIRPQQDLFGGTMFPGVIGSTGAGMGTQAAGNPLSPVPAGGTFNLFGNSQTGIAAPNVFPSLYPRAHKAPPLYSQS